MLDPMLSVCLATYSTRALFVLNLSRQLFCCRQSRRNEKELTEVPEQVNPFAGKTALARFFFYAGLDKAHWLV